MAETVNYGLYVSSDEQTKFLEWREKIAGETDSNMKKIDAALKAHDDALAEKQGKLTGTAGQVVGFDAGGNVVAQDAPEGGVASFSGRKGAVVPQAGDYTAEQVGAKASGWSPFHAGTTAPTDTAQLWIDTTPDTGGLKYYNGTAWVPVPVIWG